MRSKQSDDDERAATIWTLEILANAVATRYRATFEASFVILALPARATDTERENSSESRGPG